MTISLRHTVTATGTDSPDRQVSVNAWNASHNLTGTADTYLGFNSSGNAVERTIAEISAALTSYVNGERSVPVGFTGTIPFGLRVYQRGTTRAFTTNISLSSPLTTSTAAMVLYVDSVTGSDANAGTLSTAPKASIKSALNKVWADDPATALVLVKGGTYDYNANFMGEVLRNVTTTLAVVSWDGLPVYSTTRRNGLVWSAAGSGAYSASLTSTHGFVRVWDNSNPSVIGGMSRLTPVASLAAVQAAAGSYYHDTDTNTIHVKTFDSRSPDANIYVYDGTPQGSFAKVGATYYLENIHFRGGNGVGGGNGTFDTTLPAISVRTQLKFKDCSFGYTNQGDNFNFTGACDVISQNCQSFCAHRDGFSYARFVAGGGVPRAIEIDCTAYRNGFTTDGNNNGTTAHNGATIVRINGAYYSNQDRNVHDVNGCDSWLLGCTARDNQNTSASQPDNANFYNGTSDGLGGRMWLDYCTSSGSAYDLIIASGAVTYTSNLVTGGVNSGTPTAYTPA